MVRIKVCGITNSEDARAASFFGADAIGFVFAESPRQVSPSTAKAIMEGLPPYIVSVGVFVNGKESSVRKVARDCNLRCLQFHGEEEPAYCEGFKGEYKVIKAIRVRDGGSLDGLDRYGADAFLLDSYVAGRRGGTGVGFDWALAVEAKRYGKPIILAGGVGPDNVEEALRQVAPYAVDVSSSVERSPGKKDHDLMRRLIERVHHGV